MAFSPHAVANYFLELAERDHIPLTPMKLQKLVYFAHGWYLALTGMPLINEQVEAWQWGPVIRSLYHNLKGFGNHPIEGRIHKFVPTSPSAFEMRSIVPSLKNESKYDEQLEFVESLLQRVWEVYKSFSATQLSNMTHSPGSPWATVVSQYGGDAPKGTDIPQDVIREHFLAMSAE